MTWGSFYIICPTKSIVGSYGSIKGRMEMPVILKIFSYGQRVARVFANAYLRLPLCDQNIRTSTIVAVSKKRVTIVNS